MNTQSNEDLGSITPNSAILILKIGNERFVKNLKINLNLLQKVKIVGALYNVETGRVLFYQ
jgi:carbonic anhydrase